MADGQSVECPFHGKFVQQEPQEKEGRRGNSQQHQTYGMAFVNLPLFGVVILSGCSFMVSPAIVPGRLGLLVTLFLVQMETIKDVQEIIPVAESLAGMTVYALSSLFFICFAMFEYSLVLLVNRCRESNLLLKVIQKNVINLDLVDSIAFGLYFLSFLIFNVYYIINFNVDFDPID